MLVNRPSGRRVNGRLINTVPFLCCRTFMLEKHESCSDGTSRISLGSFLHTSSVVNFSCLSYISAPQTSKTHSPSRASWPFPDLHTQGKWPSLGQSSFFIEPKRLFEGNCQMLLRFQCCVGPPLLCLSNEICTARWLPLFHQGPTLDWKQQR